PTTAHTRAATTQPAKTRPPSPGRRIGNSSPSSGTWQQPGSSPIPRRACMRTILAMAISGLYLGFSTAAGAQEIDWKKVDTALGKTATVAGDVHRYGFPRSDLQVTLDGVAIKPAFALGSW